MNIFFSIIIPVFNRPFEILEAFESIKLQKKSNIEVLVIDDSNDDTSKNISDFIYLNSSIKIKHIKPTKRAGVSKSRNIGIISSIGNVILFLDSDDKLIIGALDHVEKAFIKYKNLDLYFGSCIYKSSRSNHYSDKQLPKIGYYSDYIKSINQPEMLPAFRCESEIRNNFLYDESLTGFEHILYLRILKNGGIFYRDPNFVRLYDDEGDDRLCISNPKNYKNMRKGYLKLIRIFGFDFCRYNIKILLLYFVKIIIYNRLIDHKRLLSISNILGILTIPVPKFFIKQLISFSKK
ncbi:hypothetical protein PMT9312_1333 [Prochlorococcus marinus str. MIT 9312]|uniref:Glycosyltransferase 2-like domain-containing protein n=1 Tax=Prochlorococcus marinus (strain MIT 9312) TaxID=74546 RepID=Q319Q2_PROM9|nr:glycosyltransferase family 2 protein [Prochlorococcus marinus]ABB50393.1 hypothetical protein PMT9312_1333 [Prochlorococcus marinus str. MIT 9312]KGF99987.1 Glycosyltransferase PglI [Prochlorococcus marinus str. MIT 9311]